MTEGQDERILDMGREVKDEGGNGWEWEHLARNGGKPKGQLVIDTEQTTSPTTGATLSRKSKWKA
jgi:hypothetical protein